MIAYPNTLQRQNVIFGVNLVDGPEAVKQVEMQANQTAVFIDRSSPNVIFYLKSSNEYGMTKSLLAYEAKDVTNKFFSNAPPNMENYVTKDELKSMLAETLTELLGGKENECTGKPDNGTASNAQSNNGSVQSSPVRIKY